jgi:putative alpha-1,2-mannosidase
VKTKINLLLLSLLVMSLGVSAANEPGKAAVDYVNPFIGTDFFGDVFPGASLPYSLVHVSPDTHNKGWLYRKGYIYTDNNIIGFTHTHGGGGGGEILLMPTVRQALQTTPGPKETPMKVTVHVSATRMKRHLPGITRSDSWITT